MRQLHLPLQIVALGIACSACTDVTPPDRGTAAIPHRATESLGSALRRTVSANKLEQALAQLPEETHAQVRAAFGADQPVGRVHVPSLPKAQALFDDIHRAETTPHARKIDINPWSRPLLLVLDSHADQVRIVRRKTGVMRDILVLPASVDVPRFTAALRALAYVRAKSGVDATADATLKVSLTKVPAAVPSSWERYAERTLMQLRNAPMSDVPGIGSGRAIRIEQLGR